MPTKRFNLNASRSSKQGTLINVGKESDEYKALTNTMTMSAEDMAELGLTEGQMAVVRSEFGQAEFKCTAGKVPLGMIFVDSNAEPLGRDRWEAQSRWYEATLNAFQSDDAVRAILVFLHHAPVTNSSLVDDDANVVRTFVPSFLKKEKTLAMFTGHAHGYERFAPVRADRSRADDGMRQYVVGTGGAESHPIERRCAKRQAARGGAAGVLELTLHPDRYAWRFVAVGGDVLDEGARRVR